ncbi:MAG: hemerythrin domain-containing protein [Spirochaetales bacterium]|nr:hemerythrin domain-containing protein [Spirochaetales bacterium]
MKPRGPLMIEHRLIEKILVLTSKELILIQKNKKVNPIFIDTVVDFIRIYADRTHHGKEEDILFKALENKNLDKKDKKMMEDLVNEHINARKVVGQLVDANKNYINGDFTSIDIIINKLSFLIDFYPNHILKEDKIFFPNTENYFSNDELDDMLNDFWEFDRKMIHEKYNRLYESLKVVYK